MFNLGPTELIIIIVIIGLAAFWWWLCGVAGRVAKRKGHSYQDFFLLSLFLSPLIGLVFALVLPSIKEPDIRQELTSEDGTSEPRSNEDRVVASVPAKSVRAPIKGDAMETSRDRASDGKNLTELGDWPVYLAVIITALAAFRYGPVVNWSLLRLLPQVLLNLVLSYSVAMLVRSGWRVAYRLIKKPPTPTPASVEQQAVSATTQATRRVEPQVNLVLSVGDAAMLHECLLRFGFEAEQLLGDEAAEAPDWLRQGARELHEGMTRMQKMIWDAAYDSLQERRFEL